MVEGQGALRVGVFCGSSSGNDPAFSGFARQTGQFLAESGIEVVYGGGRVGLMGALADGVLDAGGRVTGVMPRALIEREIAHERLTELHVVETMHERKAAMAERATAFVALPGGAGTLEEIFEQWTWAQLGIHAKPCAFLNFRGYFEPISDMVRQMVGAGFLHADYAGMLIFAETLEDLIDRFRSYVPTRPKWHDAAGKWRVEP